MLALLAEASVFIHLDPRGQAVRVPPWFKNQAQLVLQVGLNMAVPIPDLDVGEQAITCTLSFSRRPFYCSIPWKSVFGLVGEGGPGLVWPDDVPVEVAAQVHAQGQKPAGQKPPTKKGEVRELGRPKLRAVSSDSEPAGTGAEELPPAEIGITSAEPTQRVAPGEAASQPLPEPRVLAPIPVAARSVEPERGETLAEGSPTDAEVEPPPRATPSNKPPAKRELPSYLRVVK